MRLHFFAAMIALAVFVTGCEPANPSAKTTGGGDASHDHDHDDDHGHEHGDDGHGHEHGDNDDDHKHDDEHGEHDHDDHAAHGPNHGHLFALDVDGYQGEWQKFKDNNMIKMYILNTDEEPQAMPMKVDSFKVIPMTGNDSTPFVLQAVEPDADGKSSVYAMDDQELTIAIPLGVNIEIKAGDQVFKGKIDQHEPLDH